MPFAIIAKTYTFLKFYLLRTMTLGNKHGITRTHEGERVVLCFNEFLFHCRGDTCNISTEVGDYLGCRGMGAAGFLVVLPSQSRHDDGQELLEGGLDLRCELVAHLGGDDDGQAVGQQLQAKKRRSGAI